MEAKSKVISSSLKDFVLTSILISVRWLILVQFLLKIQSPSWHFIWICHATKMLEELLGSLKPTTVKLKERLVQNQTAGINLKTILCFWLNTLSTNSVTLSTKLLKLVSASYLCCQELTQCSDGKQSKEILLLLSFMDLTNLITLPQKQTCSLPKTESCVSRSLSKQNQVTFSNMFPGLLLWQIRQVNSQCCSSKDDDGSMDHCLLPSMFLIKSLRFGIRNTLILEDSSSFCCTFTWCSTWSSSCFLLGPSLQYFMYLLEDLFLLIMIVLIRLKFIKELLKTD